MVANLAAIRAMRDIEQDYLAHIAHLFLDSGDATL